MKTLFVKTLVTTAFTLLSLQSAQATDQGAAPSTDAHLSWQSPATVQYLEQRAVAAALRESNNPFPNASEEYQPNFSPAQIRYFEQREAAVRKAVQERPMKSHYRPDTSNVSSD